MTHFRNLPVQMDGVTLDSQAEARRYAELRLLLAAGEISDLRVHTVWELQPGFKRDGKRVQRITYSSDFDYVEAGRRIVEDVKGRKVRRDGTVWTSETEAFRIKRKLFLARYRDIEFRVVYA